jgi:hypothetical protein
MSQDVRMIETTGGVDVHFSQKILTDMAQSLNDVALILKE